MQDLNQREGRFPGAHKRRVRPPRLLLCVGLGIVVAAGLALAGVRSGMIERSFIYFPDSELVADPSDFGLPFQDVSFAAGDGVQLHGWLVPGEKDVTWLWFHGNAGNISHRLENLKLLHDELGVSVFLFDYRGYGRSRGKPYEEGTYRDAEAALAYLRSHPDINANRIVYFGRSLGAGVAVELATRQPPLGLILESPVPSISELARHHYPFLPVGPLLRTKYDSLAKIGEVKAPLLVLHGDMDDIVPFEGGKKLFEAANEPKEFYTIRDAGHNDTYFTGGREYFRALRRFVEGLPG
jgi:fermentation-respiration switch protein FrsA (DUF1100 family)